MTPFEIEIRIDGYAMVGDMPFDGVLAKLWFEKLKREGAFDGDYGQRLPFLEYDEERFYRISAPVYAPVVLDNTTVIKAFDADEFVNKYGPYKKTFYNYGSGPYKRDMAALEAAWVERVFVYGEGDVERIAELLRGLTHLGKKSSLGFGQIERLTIRAAESSKAVVHNGRLMRHVPEGSRWLDEVEAETGVRLARLVHPYWRRCNFVPCAFNIRKEARREIL